MRLFISIDFPEDIKEELYTWVPEMKGWKKESKDKLHMTLAFLGECTEDQKKEIHSILSGIEFPGFAMTLNGMDAFPNDAGPRIIWAGGSESEELSNLERTISQEMSPYLRQNRHKEFIPHITLARKKSRKGINHEVKKILDQPTKILHVNIEYFHLKESILNPKGSVHHILHRYPLNSNH